MMNINDYVELDDVIMEIDEAKNTKKKKFTDEELEKAQEFADSIEFDVE